MIPTLFSVSYAGLWGQHRLGLVDFIRKAGELGYEAVEIMGKRPHLSVLDTTDDGLAEIRAAAAQSGVAIASVAAYNNFTTGAEAKEVPFAEIQCSYIRQLARFGEVLGAKALRIFTGYSTSRKAYRDDWLACVSAVRECAAITEGHGIALGLQNHHDVGVGFDSYRDFLDEVDHPNCKAMFDPWSVAIHGEDLRSCAREMAPRMVQTTLADYTKQRRFAYMPGLVNYEEVPAMMRAVPLGEGFIDLPGFMGGLKEGGFEGYVAYEMCSPLRGGGGEANLDETARVSLARIRELVG